MFSYCTDPSTLGGLTWLSCFLTTGVHLSFYLSFLKVLGLLAVTAPVALAFGFLGAMAARASFAPVSWLGKGYIAIVRGVPDIAFFLFFVIALDQVFEYTRHRILCPDWDQPVRQGNDFIVCQAAKLPLGSSPEWMHETYAFGLAVITFAIVFGAFAANVLFGAMRAVPRAQLETGEAYGMTQRQTFWRILVPQMWVFALPGLSNLWMVLIKATPLLFLLGIEDIVYWARELGGTKTSKFTSYPHGDWRMCYFLALLIFYLLMTKVSETLLGRLMARLTLGQATSGGEAQRKAA
ncbi:ABC transporter permease subunit [Sulfitobacter pseudonitzschiae]|uniref:ABC transporter permease subunit n=1 Tax=Pseudosulfitobacter pseudonitzschiae TaxID=1402135 RepID=A0A9Q2P0X7_9RHOB|nr:ABC transporter permease subunit [Pseudosulfitobacter pseudonitzschiae]MBM2292380.1 ABC transporter permease subunit [Pseudosulfitobacter pseudonitzschiae]MBM2297298.1 ABC transporter permease subunit [Pseudosulfitobacter pseudonitzschiae]MBM2302212.1 ABC transporter permease subunit [Pseudosulfitobacter pseudonitzschiae]MBM2311994.1 ABC transporter permease subunit [Pseudosulfitobacter pseudonitzschiae]MBM2316908.1 ABC transporter permease subunit [Pseudosulfitobacter pseudonitzschiae]